jgi:hypothetical protein
MVKVLKLWLGWDADSTSFDVDRLRQRRSPARAPMTYAPATSRPGRGAYGKTASPTHDKPRERDPRDVLHNPRLTLDKPVDDGFDPYNTGAFNHSASWERIARQKTR